MKSPLKKRALRFVKAFPAIIHDPRLSIGAKLLYVELKGFADATGQCFPSLARMASDLNCNRKSVVAWMRELVELKIIFRAPKFKDGMQTSSQYTFNDEHFVKHLAVKPAGPKNGPLGWGKKGTTEVDPLKKSGCSVSETPDNVIPMKKAAG